LIINYTIWLPVILMTTVYMEVTSLPLIHMF